MRAGGAIETEALPDPLGCCFDLAGRAKRPTRAAAGVGIWSKGVRKVVLEFRRCECPRSQRCRGGSQLYHASTPYVSGLLRSGRNRVCATDLAMTSGFLFLVSGARVWSSGKARRHPEV